jgi:hypothetical protein
MMMTLLFFAVALFGLFTLYSLGKNQSDQDPLSDYMNGKGKKINRSSTE